MPGLAEKKTPCPISRSQFRAGAKPLTGTIAGNAIAVMPKEFSTGTMGWFTNGQTIVEINGVACEVTFQVQMYIKNSKDVPAS